MYRSYGATTVDQQPSIATDEVREAREELLYESEDDEGHEERTSDVGSENQASSPAIRVYLREMGQHSLLDKEEEVVLSQQMEEGRKTMLTGIVLTRLGCQALADEIAPALDGRISVEKIVFSGPNALTVTPEELITHLRPVHKALARFASASERLTETTCERKSEEISAVLSDLRFDPNRLEEVGKAVLNVKGTSNERSLRSAKRLIRQGWRRLEEARRRMVQGNLRLVISVARRYRNHGLDMLDLIQEGNLGLLKAVDRFDHRRGCKFSTYAVWWIRQTIRRSITTNIRPVRLPANVAELLTKMRAVNDALTQDLQRPPDNEELALHLDVSIEQVETLKRVMQSHISIDAPLGEDGETVVGHIIPDDRNPTALDEVAARMLGDRLDDVLKTLPKREETILRLRYGVGNSRVWTLEEVADRFGVTRERIRQIEVRALRRMRHPRRAARIRTFMA